MVTTNIQSFSGDVEVTSNLTVDTNALHVDSRTGRVGIGTTIPSVEFYVNGTGAIRVPVGTENERPSNTGDGLIRFNTDSTYLEYYSETVGEWTTLKPLQPDIQSFTPTSVSEPTTGTQISITGQNFGPVATGQISVIDSGGTKYHLTNYTYTNSTTISGQLPSLSLGYYDLYVYNTGIRSSAAGTQLAVTPTPPTWTSPASASTTTVYNAGGTATVTMSATHPSLTVSYSLVSGSYPTGMSLSGSTITGTPTVNGTYALTMRATVTSGAFSSYADQSFNIEVSAGSQVLYSTNSTSSDANYQWTCPQGVGSVSVCCIGPGGGGGGRRNLSNEATNGNDAGDSSFNNYITAGGGKGGRVGDNPSGARAQGGAQSGTYNGGGAGGQGSNTGQNAGGAGAGGYGGAGGQAGFTGNCGQPGGGTGILGGSGAGGQGGNNQPGVTNPTTAGTPASGGVGMVYGASYGLCDGGNGDTGGGGALAYLTSYSVTPGVQYPVKVGKRGENRTSEPRGPAGPGAVRIIWGTGRSYPNTNTADI